MTTTKENKIKISFEFNNVRELRELYGVLNCACVSVHIREQNASKDENVKYFNDVWDKLNSFTENFNPSNLNA